MTVEIKGIGKITASKETLMFIGSLLLDSASLTREKYPNISDMRMGQFDIVHDALDAVGYFDNVK